jgi:hypothetical protein
MLRLKSEDSLLHNREITRLRRAIEAIDAFDLQQQRAAIAQRVAKFRVERKRKKPSLIWRVINWI